MDVNDIIADLVSKAEGKTITEMAELVRAYDADDRYCISHRLQCGNTSRSIATAILIRREFDECERQHPDKEIDTIYEQGDRIICSIKDKKM